jgi:hypothetical protein
MPTATLIVSLNDQNNLGFSISDQSSPDTVSITGSGSGTRIVLTPASSSDLIFQLTFTAGNGIASLEGLNTPVYAGSQIRSNGGNVVVTCDDQVPFQGSSLKTQVVYTPEKSSLSLTGDPTIVFNPPSGVGAGQLEEAPVAAEPVMV